MVNPMQVKVDVKDLKSVRCSCGGVYFESLVEYRLLPALCSPSGQDQLLSLPVARCMDCKKAYLMEGLLDLSRNENIVRIMNPGRGNQ